MNGQVRRRASGEGSVFRTTLRGRDVWCASLPLPNEQGKRRFVRGYGSTPTEAIRRRQKNLERQGHKGEGSSIQLNSYFQRFIREKAAAGTQPTTIAKYKNIYDLHIGPNLGKRELRLIDRDAILEIITGPWDSLGPAAKRSAVRLLKTILNSAVAADLIPQNPAMTVKTPKTITAVRRDDERLIFERTDVLKIVLDYTRQRAMNNEPENIQTYGLFMLLALGLRRSEVLGLTRNAIKVDEKVSLYIDTQLSHVTGKGFSLKVGTKNGSSRQVFLPNIWDDAIADLDDVARQIQDKFPSQNTQWWGDMLFRDFKTGRFWTYNRFSQTYHETMTNALRSAGYDENEIKNLTFRPHYVRHLSASIMIKTGVSLRAVEKILGHSSGAMTMYYLHIDEEQRKLATEGLTTIAPKEPSRKKATPKLLVVRGKAVE